MVKGCCCDVRVGDLHLWCSKTLNIHRCHFVIYKFLPFQNLLIYYTTISRVYGE